MNHYRMLTEGAAAQLHTGLVSRLVRERHQSDDAVETRDRGAVSLEQVLWFVAAGVAVAVIAGIIFNRLTATANEAPLNSVVVTTP